jgi:membrane protein implicated in regulation of membrane protease activity
MTPRRSTPVSHVLAPIAAFLVLALAWSWAAVLLAVVVGLCAYRWGRARQRATWARRLR